MPFFAHFVNIPNDVDLILIPHLTSGNRHFILFIAYVKEREVSVFDPLNRKNYSEDAKVLAEAFTV